MLKIFSIKRTVKFKEIYNFKKAMKNSKINIKKNKLFRENINTISIFLALL